MATKKLTAELSPKFLQFIDDYQNDHSHEIYMTCNHVVNRHATVEYIMRTVMPIIDYDLYKKIFKDELDYPIYNVGKFFVTLTQILGIKNINIGYDWRYIDGKLQYVTLVNDKIIHIIGDKKAYDKYMAEIQEIENRMPKALAGDSSQLVSHISEDVKLVAESPDVKHEHTDKKTIDVVPIKQEPPNESHIKEPPNESHIKEPPNESHIKEPQNEHRVKEPIDEQRDSFQNKNTFTEIRVPITDVLRKIDRLKKIKI